MADQVRVKAIREAQNILLVARRAGGNFEALDRIWGALNHAKDEAENAAMWAEIEGLR